MIPRRSILLDAGPLVALLADDDAFNEACVAVVDASPGRLLTCWPVVAEAAWLLRRTPRIHDGMLQWIELGAIGIAELHASELSGIRAILKRYESLNAQFADACLVHLAEREGIDTIFTLDRRDFSVYRTKRGKSFRLLPEAG